MTADDITRHTEAGKFPRFRQRTMTWSEKLDGAACQVSIARLFEGERPTADMKAGIELGEVIENILRPASPR